MRVGMLVAETYANAHHWIGLRDRGSGLGARAKDFARTKHFDPPNRRCININKAGAQFNINSANTEKIAQRWHQQRSVRSASCRPVAYKTEQKSKKTADSINSRLALVMYVRFAHHVEKLH